MQPNTEREREIAQRVDAKVRAIRQNRGWWDHSITEEVRVAVPFEMTEAERLFLEAYVNWRRSHPLAD